MRRLRSFAGQFPAIIISVVALIFSVGSGAGYAAAVLNARQIAPRGGQGSRLVKSSVGPAQARAASLIWHRLALLNGWKPEPRSLNFGQPAYAVSGGIVYLRGAMHQPVPGSPVFAHLPLGARPADNLWIIIYTNAASAAGGLYIGADGKMQVTTFSGTSFVSLASVSFPRTS